jgi:hypothetical protein
MRVQYIQYVGIPSSVSRGIYYTHVHVAEVQ